MRPLPLIPIILGAAAVAACTPETQQPAAAAEQPQAVQTPVPTSDAPRYLSLGSKGIAIELPVNVEGRVSRVQLSFEYRSQCENDHQAYFYGPNDETIMVLNHGLGRCSGRWETFGAENDFDGPPFAGARAKGVWAFSMKDTVANGYTGKIVGFQLTLHVQTADGVVKYSFKVPGPDENIPEPQ